MSKVGAVTVATGVGAVALGSGNKAVTGTDAAEIMLGAIGQWHFRWGDECANSKTWEVAA